MEGGDLENCNLSFLLNLCGWAWIKELGGVLVELLARA